MKTFSLLLLAYLVILSLTAQDKGQDYLPLPTENVEWSILFTQSGNNGQVYTTRHYVPVGDTTIQDKIFAKLFSNTGKEFNLDSAQYIGAYINESNRVLFIERDSSKTRMVYDFNVLNGWVSSIYSNCDTSSMNCMFYQLSYKDTVKFSDNIARLRYNFDWIMNEGNGNYNRQHMYSWIEGIGSTLGFFPDPDFSQFLPTDPVFFSNLLCFKQNDELIYTDSILYEGKCYKDIVSNTDNLAYPSNIKIYPNPLSEKLFIEYSFLEFKKDQEIIIIDVGGKVVLQKNLHSHFTELDASKIPPGIYYILFTNKDNNNFYAEKFFKIK